MIALVVGCAVEPPPEPSAEASAASAEPADEAAAALDADAPTPPAAAPTGAQTNATQLAGWGTFDMGFNVAPHGGTQLVGNLCTGPREDKRARLFSGSGACSPGAWFTSDPNDCRFLVTWNIGGFQTGTCYWEYTTDTCSHSLCQTGAAVASTCSDYASKVCRTDPFCCANAWDSICVREAQGQGGPSC